MIRVHVDASNPGLFFACCGLHELAGRLWRGAEGWFDGRDFCLRPLAGPARTLAGLIHDISGLELASLDPADEMAPPIRVGDTGLRIDWYVPRREGETIPLKPWAGSMRGPRIARAMQAALRRPGMDRPTLFDVAMVVPDPDDAKKKVEPFYFDSRRGASSQALDIGFMPDALGMTTAAYPASEFLCLVGLQRFRPAPAGPPRTFLYSTWTMPLLPPAAAVACAGLLGHGTGESFRFVSAFRTDQRKHKAFQPATREETPR